MSDPLDQLQNPSPDQPQDNMNLINQFNHANASKRQAANRIQSGSSPALDEQITRLHGIDARLLSNEMPPEEAFDPNVTQAKNYLLSTKNPQDMDSAYSIVDHDRRRILAQDQMGGAMPVENWDSLRDYYGRKTAATSDDKQQAYQDGILQFDKLFEKHKPFLVTHPVLGVTPHAARNAQLPNDVEMLMRRAAMVGQQQQAGAPVVPNEAFKMLLRGK